MQPQIKFDVVMEVAALDAHRVYVRCNYGFTNLGITTVNRFGTEVSRVNVIEANDLEGSHAHYYISLAHGAPVQHTLASLAARLNEEFSSLLPSRLGNMLFIVEEQLVSNEEARKPRPINTDPRPPRDTRGRFVNRPAVLTRP